MADAGDDAGQKVINERVLCWVIAFFVVQREEAVYRSMHQILIAESSDCITIWRKPTYKYC